MLPKSTERGQALIVIALAAIVLFGFVALAVDGGRSFAERRNAQNVADTSALSAALAYTRGKVPETAAVDRANADGYNNNGTTNKVTVIKKPVPSGGCPGNAQGEDIQVDIYTEINSSIGRILGQDTLKNTVTATARGCGFIIAPLFPGNAIVSLSNLQRAQGPNLLDCGFSTQGNTTLNVAGGGIFSNGCASNTGSGTVNLDTGQCVNTGGLSQGFSCQNPGTQTISYPNGVSDIMPPNPCVAGGVGLTPSPGQTTFNSGVYCISDMDAFDSKNVVLNNATLYVTDTVFNLKFAGGGGFSGTATQNGTYSNYYMIIAMTNPPCSSFTSQTSQVINYRGNGSGALQGTILAPSACVDLRGNGTSSNVINSQIIAYNVSANGAATVTVEYQQDQNHQDPYDPSVSLLQ